MKALRHCGLTATEVLVSSLITLVLAAILIPLARNVQNDRTTCVENLKYVAQGMAIYSADSGSKYPLMESIDTANGTWRYPIPADGSKLIEFPHDWRLSQSQTRWAENQATWANTVLAYAPDRTKYACPSGPEKLRTMGPADGGGVIPDYNNPNPDDLPINISYNFNGLLNSFAQSGVVSPSTLPLLWEGNGKIQIKGIAMANPIIRCVRVSDPCNYIPYSGSGNCPITMSGAPSDVMHNSRPSRQYPGGPYWVHSRTIYSLDPSGLSREVTVSGMNWAYCDLHVNFRRMGAVFKSYDDDSDPQPYTDAKVDPFTGYGPTGTAGFGWTDGCWSYLFRPDH